MDMAVNGREAVEMFEQSAPGHYSLIFMDIQMPEMDGYEATASIRALSHPDAETIPIIAMTANAYKEDVEQSFAAGMNGHIGKPIDTPEMMRVLETHLTSKG
jgi:Response regulator containing a CheY-like receiver domain and an HD-GYP domain